jgi:hypothetical protein
MPNFNEGNKKRDARLRRSLLWTLDFCKNERPGGLVPGQKLMDWSDIKGGGFENENHALSLIRDLINLELVTEKTAILRHKFEKFGLRHMEYGITAKGKSLLDEHLPPEPLIDDERVSE